MALLVIQLLGSFRAITGAPLSGFDSDKVRALLAYLAIESDRPHRRERLAGLLWPDFSERSARTNLRRALSNLRQVIGDRQADPPFLIITRQSIQFNQESDHALDVTSFSSLLAGIDGRAPDTSHLEEAVALYQGDFLEGFSIPDSSSFEEWALVTRESLRGQVIRALFHLAADHEELGTYEQALQHTRRLLTLDPYQETAHQQLMRLLALCGQRNEALAHYEQMAHMLDGELGVAPSAQTQEVQQWLLAEDSPLQVAAMRSEAPESAAGQRQPSELVPRHNLPAQMTKFVGRRREIAKIEQLLETARLLTLIGPPGTGKSRLALETAARIINRFANGLFFVDLAPINDPDLIISTIAQTLGILEIAGRDTEETLKSYLQQKRLLLLLDNFEHIIDAAPLVNELLMAAPGLKILITSRQPLQIYGEQEYAVPPLIVPDLDHPEPLQTLSQFEAVELFIQHAQAVSPGFALDDVNATAVAEICVHLDGLPLAIELAAARVKLFSPELIRTRLKDRFTTLTGGSRYLPDRLQTLRAAIDWSYELLDEDEKRLFARLAVFQGGRTVEAVDTICGQDLIPDTFTLLESLLNKSLLQQYTGPDGEPRFTMLETIHEYARERLQENGETECIHKQHADYFVALAELAETELSGPKAKQWCTRLQIEMGNLRTALTWALANDEALVALRLASALRDYWYDAGNSIEGLKWTGRALERAADAPPAMRAKALNAAGMLAAAKGEYVPAEQMHREALGLSRQAGDKINQAWALVFLGEDKMDSPGEYEGGITYCQESLALFREMDHKPGVIYALTMIGELSRLSGDYEQAGQAYEECLVECRRSGHKVRELVTIGNLAYVIYHQGDYERAKALEVSIQPQFRDLGLGYHVAAGFPTLVGTVAAQGELEQAARLLGAADALFESTGVSLKRSDQFELDRHADTLHQQLDQETFEKAYAEGRAMSLEEALACAQWVRPFSSER